MVNLIYGHSLKVKDTSDLDGSKIKPYFERLDGFESVGGIASLIT